MGSGPSRRKRVAPECVSEVAVSKTNSPGAVRSPKPDSRIFKPLKIHAVLRSARHNRAAPPPPPPPDTHSQGPDSDLSGGEDEYVDPELDTILADSYEEEEEEERRTERGTAKKQPAKKSRSYGLCHLGRPEDAEDEVRAAPRRRRRRLSAAEGGEQGPHGCGGGSRDVNNRSHDAFTLFKSHTVNPTQHHGFLAEASLLDSAVPTSEKQSTFGSCHSSSLTMPVILYHGSEEELMDTIEREFS